MFICNLLIALATTNTEGNYHIVIPDSLTCNDLRIFFHFVGYDNTDVLFNPDGKTAISINPDLTVALREMMGMIIFEPNLLI